ncbi:MAG: PEP-CTERM sorting domain-containing protein, partial [Desulfobacteraceae bacterium]|nr:PEP-CTERM sorting domain-containing protein [Desulfobacteraceae bacterium]
GAFVRFHTFIPSGDTLEFSYIFGSEEYNEYADSDYNDVFGIFIDGVDYALVPETDTPVSVSSINSASYSEYYNDNDAFKDFGGFPKPYPYPFEYDGFTDALTTSVTGLTPGETYTLRLAIADAGDMFLDSGIFFPAASFKCPAAPAVPEPGAVFLLGSGLICLAAAGRKKKFLSV